MPEFNANRGLDELRAMARAGAKAASARPPGEVRSLGGRRHRRRMAGIAVASVAAAVALGGGAVAVVDQVAGSQLDPAAPAPTESKVTSQPAEQTTPRPDATAIPPDFPIDRDLADYGDDGVQEGPEFGESWASTAMPAPCGANEFLGEPAETLSVSLTAPEFLEVRELRRYHDAADAERVLEQYADAVATCPEESPDGGDSLWVYEAERQSLGDNGLLVSLDYRSVDFPVLPGMSQYVVVQVGTAVLIVGQDSEATPGTESEQLQRDAVIEIAESLVDELTSS